jgi:hypothetical protein
MFKGKRFFLVVMTMIIAGSIIFSDSLFILKVNAAETIIYYQGFDAYVEGTVPSSSAANNNPKYVPGFVSVQPRSNYTGNSITIKSFLENEETKKAVNLSTIASTTNGYNYFDMKIVDGNTPNPLLFQGKVVFENRIRLDNTTGEFFIMGKYNASAWLTFIKFINGSIMFLNTLDVGEYESNKWYRTTVTVDPSKMTADLAINGITVASNIAITVAGIDFKGTATSDSWTFRYQNNNKHATNTLSVDIDYMKYYYPTQSLELVDSNPANRQNYVSINTSDIQLEFSSELNPDTLQNITVTEHTGAPVTTVLNSLYPDIYMTESGATVYRYNLDIAAGMLKEQTEYHVAFNGVQDIYGNTINEILKFTTKDRIIGEVSSDAKLKSLKVNDTSVGGFVYSQNSYNYTLPFGSAIPVVSAEANDSVYATVSITQAQTLPGTATVLVRAENGVENIYTINLLVEAPRTNNLLKTLKVDKDFVLRFLPRTNEYSYTVPYGTTAIPLVEAEVADNTATLSITQAQTLPGTATVKVTAQDGSINNYMIQFKVKEPSKDTGLKQLKVNNIVVQGFLKDKAEYAIKLPYRTSAIPVVTAEPSDKTATLSIAQARNVGNAEAVVTVTAQDGVTKKEYSIRFIEGKMSDLYNIYGLEFKDSSGATISTLQANSTVTANVFFTNDSNASATAILALVLYGKDNSIKRVVLQEKNIDSGKTSYLTSGGLKLPENVEGYHIRFFMWDSMKNMQLLLPEFRFPLQ